MEEMRVQIEAREPTDGEIRAFWFTLPIDTEQVEELLGIDIDTDYYYITGKELPFADEVQEDTTVEKVNDLYHTYENLPSDLKEDYAELMCYFSDLDELHRYRNNIIHYSWCKNMTDVARHILNNDPDFTSLVRVSPAISIMKPTGSTLTTTDALWKPTTVSMNFRRKEVCACG